MISKLILLSLVVFSFAMFICVCICIHHAFLPLPETQHNLKMKHINIADGVMERFKTGLRYATISWDHKVQNFTALSGIQKFIHESEYVLH